MNHPYDTITLGQLRTRRSWKWRGYADDVLPLWVAEMDFPLARPIREVLVAMVESSDTGYAWSGGLAEAYTRFSAGRYGFAPDPGRSQLVPDIMRGVDVALDALTEPDSGVAFLTPAYPPFFSTVEYAHRRVVTVPMAREETGRYTLDVDRLDATLARPDVAVLLLCNPHNPTGRAFSAAELATMAELATRHDVRVFADEVHAPLTYGDVHHVPFASLDCDAARRSVTFVSASKAWNVPGLKCALVFAGGPEPWERLRSLPVEISVGASPLGVAANLAAFTDGGPWLADTLGYLDGNRRALGELLARRLPGVRYAVPEATYLAWLDCSGLGWGDDPARHFLDDARVALNSGLHYGAEGAGFVRFNFGTSRAIVVRAIDAMADAVSDG